jgi:hypothetical protein
VAVRTVLGQHCFLHSFGMARLDGLANEASDEALEIFWRPNKTANGLANEPLGKELISQH